MREEDLLRFQWIADPRISPDGSRIAFTLVSVDAEADEYRTNLWLCDVPAADGAFIWIVTVSVSPGWILFPSGMMPKESASVRRSPESKIIL